MEEGQRRFRFFVNVIVLLVALFSFAKQKGSLKYVSPFENMMLTVFAPIQSFMATTQNGLNDVFSQYLANMGAMKENDGLKKKVSELSGQIFRLEELRTENSRLKNLLSFGNEVFTEKVLAQVVAWDSNSDNKVVRINKGSSDGIRLQAPVVTSEGLIGYVYRLTSHFSDILTILDSSNRVDGLIRRTRSHGIIEGYSAQKCLMKYIISADPIILNDEVLTSGLGNIYPKGIRVGVVGRIERESYGITQYVEVMPAVDFSTLEEVIVLNGKDDHLKKVEWEALENADGLEGNKK